MDGPSKEQLSSSMNSDVRESKTDSRFISVRGSKSALNLAAIGECVMNEGRFPWKSGGGAPLQEAIAPAIGAPAIAGRAFLQIRLEKGFAATPAKAGKTVPASPAE
jgi:hypothetical protein